jgi:hypothetical protein
MCCRWMFLFSACLWQALRITYTIATLDSIMNKTFVESGQHQSYRSELSIGNPKKYQTQNPVYHGT